MTVSAAPNFNLSTGNGVTTVFSFGFGILDASHLKVYLAGVLQSAGYTVAGVGATSGGTVAFTVAPANGVAVLLKRSVPRTRTTDFITDGDFTADDIDNDQDLQTMLIQDASANADRAIKVPESGELLDLPVAATRANKALLFDATGAPTVGSGIIFSGAGTIAVTNVAALKALLVANLSDGQIVSTLGYNTAAIGGGARYRWDAALAAAPDDVYYFQLNAGGVGRFVLLHSGTITLKQGGCKGDDATDDAARYAAVLAAAPAYSVIDATDGTYRLTAGARIANVGVKMRGGKFRLDNDGQQFLFVVVPSDYCTFEKCRFTGSGVTGTAPTPKYQGGIHGGNSDHPAPLNVTPANGVTVKDCIFENLTVGIWSGGAAAQAVPVGWSVVDNQFTNIVGFAGQSEGYGTLFTPCSRSVIRGNKYKTIRRHAIYLASESSFNGVDGNVIDGVDNIAIQSNTGVAQNYADQNSYTNNIIRGFTRSIAYGYRSSVGIGLYGKHSNSLVQNNSIFGALDTGIDCAGELAGSNYAEYMDVLGNKIIMDATATDGAIRADGLFSGKISGNKAVLQSNIYGVIVTSTNSVSTKLLDVSGNTFDTTAPAAIAFRLALVASRTIHIYRNKLNGFAAGYSNRLTDTSTAGIRKTDLNDDAGFYGADADVTHNAQGTIAQTDCPKIRHAAVLTAARLVTLANTNVPHGAEVTIMRTGAGAFSLNVSDGGTIKGLATGQWGRFVWNGGGWELGGFGSL